MFHKNPMNFEIIFRAAKSMRIERNKSYSPDNTLSNIINDIVNQFCTIDNNIDNNSDCDDIYKVGTAILLKWVCYALMDICNNKVDTLTNNTTDFILKSNTVANEPLSKLRDNVNKIINDNEFYIWSRYNIFSLNNFVNVLMSFDFSEFDISKLKFKTDNKKIDERFKLFINGSCKPSNIDLYMIYLLQSKPIYQINPYIMDAYDEICNFFATNYNKIFNCFIGILMTELSCHVEKENELVENKTKREFDIDELTNIIKTTVLIGDYYGKYSR